MTATTKRHRSGAASPALLVMACGFAWAITGSAADTDDQVSVQAPLADQSLLLDAARIDEFIAIVGERGHVLLSDDDGANWRQVITPDRATLTTVYFADRQHGWAAGHDAVILRTTDGGESWDRVMYAPGDERPFLDIWFRDAQHGYAVGAYGLFMETGDGGASWTDVSFAPQDLDAASDSLGDEGDDEGVDDDEWYDDDAGADYHLNSLVQAPNGTLYVAAEAGYVYRSEDGGTSWFNLSSPYEGSFFGALPVGDNGLLVVGLRGHMYLTRDSGQSWQAISLPTEATLNNATRLSDGTIVVTGMDGTVLVSDDNAASFDLVQQSDRRGIAIALETRSGEIILIGAGGIKHLARDALNTG